MLDAYMYVVLGEGEPVGEGGAVMVVVAAGREQAGCGQTLAGTGQKPCLPDA